MWVDYEIHTTIFSNDQLYSSVQYSTVVNILWNLKMTKGIAIPQLLTGDF